MRTRIGSTSLRACLAVLALAAACATTKPVAKPPAIDSLVSTAWLAEHLGEPDLVVLDCTVKVAPKKEGGYVLETGLADWEKGHIPGAAFADLAGDLSAGDGPFRFAMPAPEQFAAAMAALGVGDDSRVVLYSANNPAWAARVWWMLRWIGFDRAALLDGGLRAWTAEGRPLSTEPVVRPAGTLAVRLRPHLIADRDEVRAAIGNPAVRVIDALPEAHYAGKMKMYARPGHIAGAENIPATDLTDETTRFLPPEMLAEIMTGDRTTRAITYCGGGVAASSNAFVMTRLGFTDVAVYMGSLQEWTADPANPMEVGAQE